MKNFLVLNEAFAYIEDHLDDPITPDSVSAACCCSASMLQKLFAYAVHMGVAEYISRRRLTKAAKALLEPGRTVLDVALAFQYGSHEAFTRAFTRCWGIPPSAFRRERQFTDLFPRIEEVIQEESGMMRKLDISELYDYLKARTGTYTLCFDICGLDAINRQSRKAGDLVILECLRRLEQSLGEEMLMFRTGGDEFVLVTNLKDKDAVIAQAEKVLAKNGEPVVFDGKEFPTAMRAGALQIPEHLRYSELFTKIQHTIDRSGSPNTVYWLEG
ncbi:MAG: helix-turn-helix domain-containing protein [Oscillospiraceae bacterium]|jgi:AraC family transcriptional regulator|nr:helix-turn-helix domain-containing protein [Oscillospiraceae bacterium]